MQSDLRQPADHPIPVPEASMPGLRLLLWSLRRRRRIAWTRCRNLQEYARVKSTASAHLVAFEANVTWLHQRSPDEESIEHVVDRFKDARVAPKIRGQIVNNAAIGFDFLYDAIEGFHIGATKCIDRLFGVTDDEKFAGLEHHALPVY